MLTLPFSFLRSDLVVFIACSTFFREMGATHCALEAPPFEKWVNSAGANWGPFCHF